MISAGFAEGRWVHHVAEGFASRADIIEVPTYSGPEPWPANWPWYPDPEQRAEVVAERGRRDPAS